MPIQRPVVVLETLDPLQSAVLDGLRRELERYTFRVEVDVGRSWLIRGFRNQPP